MTAAVAATSLAACSGASKQEFIDAADEVCREADERITEIGGPRLGEDVYEYVTEAERISEELVSDLRALEPPEEGREQVDRMLDDLERATALLEPLARATVERQAQELEDLQQEVVQLTDEINETAESYGFEVCGAKVLDPIR